MKQHPEGKLDFNDHDTNSSLILDEKVGKRLRDGSLRSEDNPDGSKRMLNDDDESEIEYIDENGKKRRAKRRSKNDLDGRDYKCSFCAKTYLSYPALYTHMKTKHSKGSDGQYLLLNSGRGRGRPKKNAGRVTTIDPESDDYFKTLDKGGGPTDPLYYIDKIIEEYFSDKGIRSRHKEERKFNEFVKNEENKSYEDMPPPSPHEENKDMNDDNSDVKMESEELHKSAEDQSSYQPKSEMKEESEEGKSESQYKLNYESKKSAFKQFDFITYNNYKEYPLYKILSKKRLFDGQDLIDPKVEVKEENNDTENQEEQQNLDDDKMDVDDKEESKHSNTSEEKDEESEQDEPPKEERSEDPEVEGTERSKDHIEQDEGESNDGSNTHEVIKYGKKRFDQVLEDYEALTFEQKQRLSCDDVCGIYLREISQKVNTKFYKTLLRFVILFRE